MRIYLLVLTICIPACTPKTARMPDVPTSGWNVDEGEHRSWSQDTAEGHWQVADYNSDGRVDYVRYQVPRYSYNHRLWLDHDFDGFFEKYIDVDPGNDLDIHMPVIDFKPASHPPQLTRSIRDVDDLPPTVEGVLQRAAGE